MHQAKGRVQPLEPSLPLEKPMPFPWCPRKAAAWQCCFHQHCVFLSAYWPRQFPVLPKPKAIPGSTFPVWQTTPTGGTGVTKAQWHYRQTCRCQWVFTGGNVMMGECTSCQWRQKAREALEILRIYLQYYFLIPFSVCSCKQLASVSRMQLPLSKRINTEHTGSRFSWMKTDHKNTLNTTKHLYVFEIHC